MIYNYLISIKNSTSLSDKKFVSLSKKKIVFDLYHHKKNTNRNVKEEYDSDNKIDDNFNLLTFITEISYEIKNIEWPSFERLFRQFVVVIISLVFSGFFIYSVDGIFGYLSRTLFENN